MIPSFQCNADSPVLWNVFCCRAGPLIGLLLIALGTGGIKPCVSAFGGDQFTASQVNTLYPWSGPDKSHVQYSPGQVNFPVRQADNLFLTQKESACQISADSEQLEKSQRNRYSRLPSTEPFNYNHDILYYQYSLSNTVCIINLCHNVSSSLL